MFLRSHAYDVYAIKVGHIPNGVVGEPVEFESNYKRINIEFES